MQIIIMGVSGCGKTTVGAALAKDLGLPMLDGDDLHLPESVAKMRNGVALQDADRWPWLDRVGEQLALSATSGGLVVACSALRRAYRDRIRRLAPSVRFVYLYGSFELIAQRLSQRVGHYMQADLLASQFQALEPPAADEADVISLDIATELHELVEAAVVALRQPGAAPGLFNG